MTTEQAYHGKKSFVQCMKQKFKKKTRDTVWDSPLAKHANDKDSDTQNCDLEKLFQSKWQEAESGWSRSDEQSDDDVNELSKANSITEVFTSKQSRYQELDNMGDQARENPLIEIQRPQYGNGARPKTKLASPHSRMSWNQDYASGVLNKEETQKRRVLKQNTDDVDENGTLEELQIHDKTSDYGTLQKGDISSDEESDENFRVTKAFSKSEPSLSNKTLDEDMKDLRPLNFFNIKNSKDFQITPDGSAKFTKKTVKNHSADRHVGLLASVRGTYPRVETELFKGGQAILNRNGYYTLVILKGSGYGCGFAAKMLFEQTVSENKGDAKPYFLKTADELSDIRHEEKAIILVLDANGPTGSDVRRLDSWYECLKERMPLGASTMKNLTLIMTLQDDTTERIKEHPIMYKYREYIVDASEKRYRPSSRTKDKLLQAVLRQNNFKVNPVKGGAIIQQPRDGKLSLFDKEIVDGLLPLLGSVRYIRKLADFFKSDMSEGLNTLRKPIPEIVRRIRKSYKEGGVLFLTLLAVHAHGGHLGVGRINQMRKQSEQTEKFWYSADNISKKPKGKSKKNLAFDNVSLQHLQEFAKKNGHLMNLGENIQKYARRLDGEFLAEMNDVYRFCDGRVFYSFLLVYCEMYPDAVYDCEDEFFFNFVKSRRHIFEDEKDIFLKIDDRKLNQETRAVMKRFEKEIMLRHVARCMKHQIMSPMFFQLFLKYLAETPHKLWKILKQQDCDPKEPYSCLYHGLDGQSETFKNAPRNISEVIILHDIWKNKRRKPKWKRWIKAQEEETLIRAAEFANFKTFEVLVSKGTDISTAALKKALDVGAKDVIDFIIQTACFGPEEWADVAQHAADLISNGLYSQSLVQSLTEVISKTDISVAIGDKPPLIHYAVSTKNAKLLKLLLNGDINGTAVDVNIMYCGETPLAVATRMGLPTIVKILLETNRTQIQNEVLDASILGHVEVLEKILDRCPVLPESRNYAGQTAVHVAAERGHKRIVSLLISKGFDLTSEDYNNETPLSLACKGRHIQTARLILSNLNQQDYRVFLCVLQNDHVELLDLLIEYNYNVNFVSPEHGAPLIVALQNEKHDMVRYLLSKEANPNILQGNQRPVHFAAAKGDVKSFHMLMNSGANIIAKTSDKCFDIIHIATEESQESFVEAVLNMQTSSVLVNSKTVDGDTALHIASRQGSSALIQVLLRNGFSSEILNKYGLLPITLAANGLKEAIATKERSKWNLFADCVKILQMH